MNRTSRLFLSIPLAVVVAGTVLGAPAKGVRSSGRSNVNSNKNVNVNQNKNVNRNTNVNVNRDVDIDVDVDHHHGGYYGGCCYHDYHPVATVATVMVTAAIIGSMVTTLPPSCTMVMINGFAYQQCGSTWYQPQISGSSTTYIVVNAPR